MWILQQLSPTPCPPRPHKHTADGRHVHTNLAFPAKLNKLKFSLCSLDDTHRNKERKKRSLILSKTTSSTRLSFHSHQHVSCDVTNARTHAQTHTHAKRPSHNNTPFLCAALLLSGNSGEGRYLRPPYPLGVDGQQRPRVCAFMWHCRELQACRTLPRKASSADNRARNVLTQGVLQRCREAYSHLTCCLNTPLSV